MNTTVDTNKQTKKRKRASLNTRRARMGWIFVLPFILGLVLVYLPVIVESISYSLADTTRFLLYRAAVIRLLG